MYVSNKDKGINMCSREREREREVFSTNREERVEPLDPPPDSKAGDRVYVDGYQHDVAGGEVQCTEYGTWSLSVALCPLQKSIRGQGIEGLVYIAENLLEK